MALNPALGSGNQGSAILPISPPAVLSGIPRLVTRQEAAEILRTPACTLAKWASEKRGPRYIRVGRRACYLLSDLAVFVEKLRTQGLPKLQMPIESRRRGRPAKPALNVRGGLNNE
jgi:hypothetical protein